MYIAPGSRRLPMKTDNYFTLGQQLLQEASFVPGGNFVSPINKWQFHSLLIHLRSMANPISENRIVERLWTDARH